jgi:hypothetical protein
MSNAGKRSTRAPKIGSALTLRLRALGCVYCAECRAFMDPDHGPADVHINLAVDLRAARYQVVGGFGHARMVDTLAEAVVDDYASDTPMALDAELSEAV